MKAVGSDQSETITDRKGTLLASKVEFTTELFYSLEQSPKKTLLYPRSFSLSNRLKHFLCTFLDLWDEEYATKIWCESRSTYVVPIWGIRIMKQDVMGSLRACMKTLDALIKNMQSV